jgi:hypothetical protein
MLLFMDGVGHYDSSGIGAKYSTVDVANCTWTVTTEGRFGNCLKRAATGSSTAFVGHLVVAPLTTRLAPWSPPTGGVCGFAIRVDNLARTNYALTAGYDNTDFFSVREGAGFHVSAALNKDGTFTLIRNETGVGGSLVVLAQSSEGLTSNAWAYVEFRWTIDIAAGTFDIRVNGVPVLTYTGRTRSNNVLHSNLGVWNAVHLLGAASEPSPFAVMRMCDLYLADLASADPDDVSDFLGDGVIQTILPNGAGASSLWSPSSGANWECVDDRPAPDGDGTTISATATATKDTYPFEDIPPVSVVKGIHVNILARKEEEGSAVLAPVVRQSGTDYLGTPQGVAGITYDRYLTQAWDLNPATNEKFTAAEVNGGEFGVVKTF